jgi:signal peptidase II
MSSKTRLIGSITLCGFFVFLDQILKHYARNNPQITWYILKPWLGWEYFNNPGVAFSLPIPQWIILSITPGALLLIILFCVHSYSAKQNTYAFASLLIFCGALSNYIDRVIFGVTIDYIRIATGVINIADVLITVGIIIFLLTKTSLKKES